MATRRLWLCAAPAAMCVLDAGVTLAGQPDIYWAGRYDTALEFSPLYVLFLHTHPLAFAGGVAAWITVFSVTILRVPVRLGLVLSAGVVMSHGFGAASWLVDRVPGGPWLLFAVYGGGRGCSS